MSSTKSMVKRTLTHHFKELRDRSLSNRIGHGLEKEEEGMPLIDRQQHRVSLQQSNPPIWLENIKKIEDDITSLEVDLTKFSRKLDNISFGASVEEEEKILTSQAQNIIKVFSDIKRQIIGLGDEVVLKRQEAFMHQNIKNLLLLRLRSKVQYFNQLEALYQKKLAAKKGHPLVLGGLDLANEDEYDDEDDIEYFNLDGEETVQLNDILIEQRYEAFQEISRQVNSLASVFEDISSIVHDQGTIMDRIDYNIETAHMNIEAGTKELKSTAKSGIGFSKKLCFIWASVIIFSIIIIIINIVRT